MDKDEYRIAVKKLVGYVLRNDIPIRPKNFKQEHLNQILEVEFDGRRLDNLNWGVYRINDEGEVYPTPFVQCQTLGHALYRYAIVYAKKAEAYAVAPLMTDEETLRRLYKDYPELLMLSRPK